MLKHRVEYLVLNFFLYETFSRIFVVICSSTPLCSSVDVKSKLGLKNKIFPEIHTKYLRFLKNLVTGECGKNADTALNSFAFKTCSYRTDKFKLNCFLRCNTW